MAFTANKNAYQFVIGAKDATKVAFDSIDGNITKLDKGIQSIATTSRAVAGTVAVGMAAIGAAGVSALSAITVAAADSAHEIDVLSSVAGLSAERFQEMSYAASQFNVEQDKLSDILKDVNDKVGDFLQNGGGPMADFFNNIAPRVGVTAEQFRNLNSADALQLYVSSLEKANVSQSEMTFYMEAIASDATTLLPLLKNNGEALNSGALEARALGAALSDIEITQLTELDQQLKKNQQTFDGFNKKLGAEFAPIILAVSNEFLNAAKEAGGFGNIATRVFDAVVSAAGYTANVIHGLKAVWDGLKLIVISSMEVVLTYFETIEKGVRAVLQYVPGIKVSTESALTGIRESVSATKKDIQDEFKDALNAPMPYDAVVTWAGEVKSQADEVARSIVAAKNGQAANDGASNRDGDPQVIAAQQRIAQLKFLKESQLATDAEQDELALLQRAAFFGKNKELAAQYQIDLTQISNQGYLERMKFERSSLKDQSKQVFGTLANITSGVANHNKGLFRLNQLAGIANATINTAEGVTKALSAYPPPLSFVMAAAQLAAGVAQISAIKSAKFGGGGSAGNVGGAPAVGTTPITTAPSNIANQVAANEAKQKPQQVIINIDPDANYSGRTLQELSEKVAEQIGYGVKFAS